MKGLWLAGALILVITGLFLGSRIWRTVAPPVLSFPEECLQDGNMWHSMPPLKNGETLPGDERQGCMTADGMQHIADHAAYKAAKNPGESDVSLAHDTLRAGVPVKMEFALHSDTGVPDVYLSHERYLHVVIVSEDLSVFSHIHPDEDPGFSLDDVAAGVLNVTYTFPKAGKYLIAVDYANQLKPEARQFRVEVSGDPPQGEQRRFQGAQRAGDIDVELSHALPVSGSDATFRFTFERGGSSVTDLQPYLGAAMHVAVVKNDLSQFIHAHGEVHTPGQTPPKTHVHVPPPKAFGPTVETHVTFPEPGTYTLIGQFKHRDTVRSVMFTVRVE